MFSFARVTTYLERDVQALSAIEHLVDFRRLMRIAALRSGKVVNQSEMARDAGLSQATAHRYLNLLEASHLLYRLPAYAVNRTKRLVKSPRLFFCDSGLAAALAGVHSPREMERADVAGAMLETLVLADLCTWREARSPRPEILWWRTASGEEVGFVVERGERLVPIEVKASGRPRPGDIRHLHAFLDEYADLATHGVLLHAGRRAERLSQRVWQFPSPWPSSPLSPPRLTVGTRALAPPAPARAGFGAVSHRPAPMGCPRLRTRAS